MRGQYEVSWMMNLINEGKSTGGFGLMRAMFTQKFNGIAYSCTVIHTINL